MAIVMNAPTYVARLKNPVEQWLQNFDSEMGFTEPRLNGIPIMDDDALNPGKMVSAKAHLKCNLNLPEISAWKEAEAEDEFSDEVWVGEVSRRPINTFDWTVTLPPRGPWRVEMVSGLDASRLVG